MEGYCCWFDNFLVDIPENEMETCEDFFKHSEGCWNCSSFAMRERDKGDDLNEGNI